jgi:hypothetical protein
MPEDGLIVITNAIPPFDRHNITILSLPPGARYHFRYPKGYISQGAPTNIEGLRGLLVVRDKQTAGMLPVRWFTGIGLEDYGQFLFLDLRFDLIFDLRNLQEDQAWSDCRQRVEAVLPQGTKNIPGADLSPLVFRARASEFDPSPGAHANRSSEASPDDHVRRWLAAVSLLGQLETYKNDNFYTVSRVYREKPGELDLRTYGPLRGARRGYRLDSDRVYFMEVVQATAPLGSPHGPREELVLSSPAGHIQELHTSWLIDGAYDRARFFFYVLPQEQTTVPSVLMLSKRPADGARSARPAPSEEPTPTFHPKPPGPPTLLHADVAWSRNRWLFRRILPALAVIAGLLVFFSADHIAEWWPLRGVPKGNEYLRYAAIFAIGWALNSFSSFVNSLKVTTRGQG